MQYPAVQIPARPGNYVARTAAGEAAFLLRGPNPPVVRPPLRLRHVEVDYGARCRVAEAGTAAVEGEFIAIRCTDSNAVALELFVRTVEALLATLPIQPTPSDTESLIAVLVELFRKLGRPSARSIKGLWAELFVIDKSGLVDSLVTAWHADAVEKYDFFTTKGYLEVKATEQPQHIHEFSLAQLRGPSSADSLVASLLLRRATGGVGVLDLARRVTQRLRDATLRAKTWANVFEVLGNDFQDAHDLSFDERYAEHTLGVVIATDVPCIELPLPQGVLDARVVSDLTIAVAERNLGISAISRIAS